MEHVSPTETKGLTLFLPFYKPSSSVTIKGKRSFHKKLLSPAPIQKGEHMWQSSVLAHFLFPQTFHQNNEKNAHLKAWYYHLSSATRGQTQKMSRDLTRKLVAESLRPIFLLLCVTCFYSFKHFSYIYSQKIHLGYKNILFI